MNKVSRSSKGNNQNKDFGELAKGDTVWKRDKNGICKLVVEDVASTSKYSTWIVDTGKMEYDDFADSVQVSMSYPDGSIEVEEFPSKHCTVFDDFYSFELKEGYSTGLAGLDCI